MFENRNRSYGAYVLRRAYSKRVILGWGITVALFAALLYLSDLTLPDASDIIAPFKNEKESGEIKLTQPPSIPTRPPQRQQPPRATTSKQIVVTTDPVETTAETIENTSSITDDTGLGGDVDGSVDGTVTEPLAPPVAVTPLVVKDFAEVMPEYIGGYSEMMKYIQKKTRYPNSARRLGIFGTVYVRFIVRPDGQVTDVEVIRGVSKDCDAEAARVISSMPKWTPARQNGMNVPVRIVVPIKFALQ